MFPCPLLFHMIGLEQDISIVENFLSLEEIEKIRGDIFNLRPYWKNMLDYPGLSDQVKDISRDNIRLLVNNLKNDGNKTVKQISTFLQVKYRISKVPPQTIKNFLKPALDVDNPSDEFLDHLCNDIKSSVFEKDICQNMLGDAIYLLKKKKNLIDFETQKIVRTEFNWVHKKLVDSLQEVFNNRVLVSKNLPCPGFHIFGPCECQHLEFSYHQDLSILEYYPRIDPNTIYSYVSLIQSPSEKPFLDYKSGKKYYDYTNLYIWKGNIDHRIGTFSLNKDEYRITFQGHLFYDADSKNIKLFF